MAGHASSDGEGQRAERILRAASDVTTMPRETPSDGMSYMLERLTIKCSGV